MQPEAYTTPQICIQFPSSQGQETPEGYLSIHLAKPLLVACWKRQYRNASNPTLLSVLFNEKTINQGEWQYYILFTFY